MDDSEIRATVAPGHELVGQPYFVGGKLKMFGGWRYECSCGELHGATAAEAQRHLDELRLPMVLDS